jgi:hypothetical protein
MLEMSRNFGFLLRFLNNFKSKPLNYSMRSFDTQPCFLANNSHNLQNSYHIRMKRENNPKLISCEKCLGVLVPSSYSSIVPNRNLINLQISRTLQTEIFIFYYMYRFFIYFIQKHCQPGCFNSLDFIFVVSRYGTQ